MLLTATTSRLRRGQYDQFWDRTASCRALVRPRSLWSMDPASNRHRHLRSGSRPYGIRSELCRFPRVLLPAGPRLTAALDWPPLEWPGRMLVQHWSWGHGQPGRRRGLSWCSRPSGQGWDEHLRGGRLVARRGMGPDRVGVPAPAFDGDLRLPQAVEDLAVERLVPEPAWKLST